MLGRTKTSDINQTGPEYPCSLTQPSFQEPAGHEGPDSVAPVVIPALAPNAGYVTQVKVPASSQSTALLFGQDLRPQAVCFLSPLRKALAKTSHLPLSPHGSSRL